MNSQKIFARFLCIMLGCGTLLPWNTVLTALDYLQILFSKCRLDYLPVFSMLRVSSFSDTEKSRGTCLQMSNFTGNLLFLFVQLYWTRNRELKSIVGFIIHVTLISYLLFLVATVHNTAAPEWVATQSSHFSILVVGMGLSGAACASLQENSFVACWASPTSQAQQLTWLNLTGRALRHGWLPRRGRRSLRMPHDRGCLGRCHRLRRWSVLQSRNQVCEGFLEHRLLPRGLSHIHE